MNTNGEIQCFVFCLFRMAARFEEIVTGKQVLLVWGEDTNPEQLKAFVENLTGKAALINIENQNRLHLCKYCQFYLYSKVFIMSRKCKISL